MWDPKPAKGPGRTLDSRWDDLWCNVRHFSTISTKFIELFPPFFQIWFHWINLEVSYHGIITLPFLIGFWRKMVRASNLISSHIQKWVSPTSFHSVRCSEMQPLPLSQATHLTLLHTHPLAHYPTFAFTGNPFLNSITNSLNMHTHSFIMKLHWLLLYISRLEIDNFDECKIQFPQFAILLFLLFGECVNPCVFY